jgi:hypothetical protein
MNTDQITTALGNMGFTILNQRGNIFLVSHPAVSGALTTSLETNVLGVAMNWLVQNEASEEAQDIARTALIAALKGEQS